MTGTLFFWACTIFFWACWPLTIFFGPVLFVFGTVLFFQGVYYFLSGLDSICLGLYSLGLEIGCPTQELLSRACNGPSVDDARVPIEMMQQPELSELLG